MKQLGETHYPPTPVWERSRSFSWKVLAYVFGVVVVVAVVVVDDDDDDVVVVVVVI